MLATVPVLTAGGPEREESELQSPYIYLPGTHTCPCLWHQGQRVP